MTAAPAETLAVAEGAGSVTGWSGQSDPLPGEDWRIASLGGRVELVQTGVGKVNAAAAAARLVDPARHAAVINLGICGALPASLEPRFFAPVTLGEVVCAFWSVYADEGVHTPTEFVPIHRLGFPLEGRTGGAHFSEGRVMPPAIFAGEVLKSLGPEARCGPIATVSTCSGTDALALEIATRTKAVAEAMEGAAIGHVLARLYGEFPFCEVRVVSNTTGDRDKQVWDIKRALARLREVSAAIARLAAASPA